MKNYMMALKIDVKSFVVFNSNADIGIVMQQGIELMKYTYNRMVIKESDVILCEVIKGW